MSTAQPLHLEVADAFTERVRSGDLKSGDLLPSTTQLAEQYDISMATAYRAIRLLAPAHTGPRPPRQRRIRRPESAHDQTDPSGTQGDRIVHSPIAAGGLAARVGVRPDWTHARWAVDFGRPWSEWLGARSGNGRLTDRRAPQWGT
jgi:DNA-binding transcriptional MocR family regulator